MDRRKVPGTLQEAYLLRDTSDTPEEWKFYQEYVYTLRAQKYRSHNIKTKRSLRRRAQRSSRTLLADSEDAPRPWWKQIFGYD